VKTKKLVTSAMLLAFATILSLIRIIQFPFGGSVTLVSMMPIIILTYMYGCKWGLFASFVFSLLQLATGFDTVSAFFLPGDAKMALPAAISICLIDYILAYTALGLGGVFKNKLKNPTKEIVLGTIVALTTRYIFHIISGYVFFGAWAEWFFGDSTGLMQIGFLKPFCQFVMNNAGSKLLSLIYSVIYNGAYMIPEIILTAFIVPVVFKILKKQSGTVPSSRS